jgi:hypothetical protein
LATPLSHAKRKEKRHHIHPPRIFKLFGASFGQAICRSILEGINNPLRLRQGVEGHEDRIHPFLYLSKVTKENPRQFYRVHHL